MDVTVRTPWRKIGVLIAFAVMVTVNALANTLPLNGVETGQVADAYRNLFTPAPLTFAIWGAIYLFLFVYVIYQLMPVRGESVIARQAMLRDLSFSFIGTSLLNAGWIFAWHYKRIGLSMVLMALLLLGLIRAGWLLREPHCNPREELALRVPFGLYFGWITVATIANAVTLLKSLSWNGFGIADPVWTAVILTVGAAIAAVTMYRIRSVAYGLAVLWAYAGILNRHLSPAAAGGFAGEHTLVIAFTIAMLAVLLAALVMTGIHMRKVAACAVPKA
jgi:hypothetical protein